MFCAGALALALATCGSDERPPMPVDRLLVPSGAAIGPDGDSLLVTNSDLDDAHGESALVVLDLAALEEAIAAGECPAADDRVECDATALTRPALARRLPPGAGNIAVDRPAGPAGPARLLIPSRVDAAITWIDVTAGPGDLRLECGEDGEGRCDELHTLRRLRNYQNGAPLPRDPSRVTVDAQGFRYAYLPHLLGGRFTLIALDGEHGPEIAQIREEVFVDNGGLAGGFSVAQRPCDPDDPPAVDPLCERPYLYVGHRYAWALRVFQVQDGKEDLVLRESVVLNTHLDPEVVEDRPFMGDLAYEDDRGQRLLAVHTTPPMLARIDTSQDADGEIAARVLHTLPLCRNPNLLAVDRPEAGEPLALVSCFSDDAVTAVALGAFVRVATIPVGAGPNELVIDDARRWLIVVNTVGNSLSIIDLDQAAPGFLKEIARVVPPAAS